MTTVRPVGPVLCGLAQGRRVVIVVARPAPSGRRARPARGLACAAVCLVLVVGGFWL